MQLHLLDGVGLGKMVVTGGEDCMVVVGRDGSTQSGQHSPGVSKGTFPLGQPKIW